MEANSATITVSQTPLCPEMRTTLRPISQPKPVPRLDLKLSRSPRSSAIGPRSWEDTINEMSIGLQQICGSPLSTPVSPRPNTPLLLPPEQRGSSPLQRPTSIVSRQLFKTRPEMRRAESLYGSVTRPQQRPLLVRHIETQEQLKDKLSLICRPTLPSVRPDASAASQSVGTAGTPPEVVPRHTSALSARSGSPPEVLSRPTSALSARTALRLKTGIQPSTVEELIVAVREERNECDDVEKFITVRSVHRNERQSSDQIFESPIPRSTQHSRLHCYVIEDGESLLIRELTKEGTKVEFTGTDCVFLPVVYQNEAKRELVIALHVSEIFRFEDITVKTVDNNLVVTGSKKCFSPPLGVQSTSFAYPSTSGSGSPPSSCFQVNLQLPDGTSSRSVSAWLTKYHQIIIKGRLGPTSRRCTM